MSHALQGIWEMIRAESAGEPSSDLLALRIELHLGAETYHVHFAGELADQGTYSRADSEPPATFKPWLTCWRRPAWLPVTGAVLSSCEA